MSTSTARVPLLDETTGRFPDRFAPSSIAADAAKAQTAATDATDARDAAQAAAIEAQAVPTTSDTIMAGILENPASATSTTLAAAYGGGIRASNSSKKYRTISGVIRSTGTDFAAISDAAHAPVGISTVVADGTKIRVTYDFVGANVTSLVCGVDETYAQRGFICGASVTANYADITLVKMGGVADYVYYNGTVWVSHTGAFSSLVYTAGSLVLTHPNVYGNTAGAAGSPLSGSVTARDGSYIAGFGGGHTSSTTVIQFRDYTGALITTPTTNMKAYVTRSGPMDIAPNGPLANVSGANIWIHGVMEVA